MHQGRGPIDLQMTEVSCRRNEPTDASSTPADNAATPPATNRDAVDPDAERLSQIWTSAAAPATPTGGTRMVLTPRCSNRASRG